MFKDLDFKTRYEVGKFLRPLGKIYYVYILLYNEKPFYVGTSSGWKRVYGHFSENKIRTNFLVRQKIKKIHEDGGVVIIRLHQQYETVQEMYTEEIRLIKLYGKKIDKDGGILCNLSDGGEGRAGIGTSEKQKIAVKLANTGKPKSQTTRDKLSVAVKKAFAIRGGTFKGKKHSKETRELMSKNNSGTGHPQYGTGGEGHFNHGKKHTQKTRDSIRQALSLIDCSCSEERKQKLKDFWATQPLLTCPHCQKTSTFKPAMVRFHFDNCKVKEELVVEPLTQHILQNVI